MALPVRDFIIQRVLEFDSTFDVGAGVPTTTLMIDPLSIILQPVVDELTVVQASQSILTILESEDPDSFPEDIVDGLASNAFVDRNPGSIGSSVQRIRFFSPQQFSAQQGVLTFRGSGSERYTNSEAVEISEAEMSLNQDGNLYFVDVPIIALEEGSVFNADAGSITTMEAEPANVANTTNLFDIQDGRDRETNTELIARIRVAVTVRALVTGRGIIVTLTENFTTIEEITPIGFGDPEMMRDIVFNTHIGGNVDVYVKVPTFTSESQDFQAMQIDLSRPLSAQTTVTLFEPEPITYFVGNSPLNRATNTPTVKSLDGLTVYLEGTDYTLVDSAGTISRIAAGAIYHSDEIGADITASDTIELVGAFAGASAGMRITIDVPSAAAGTYTIKTLTNDAATIYGDFPVSSLSGVDFSIDEVVCVSYDYSPTTVDIIETARSIDREPYTITDTPVMQVTSVQILDPLSLQPTGEVLSGLSGYGVGGYGQGGYGQGEGGDYRLEVAEPTLRHSTREDLFILFDAAQLGRSLRVNYEWASAIAPIQAFVDDRNEQSQSASLLVRHYIPVFVDGLQTIQYDINAADEASALTVDEMTSVVTDFINDVDEGADLQASDIVDVMYDNGAVRVDLGNILALQGAIQNHDGSEEFVVPSSDGSMTIPSDTIEDPTDKPLSPRIARFRSRNITLQRNVV